MIVSRWLLDVRVTKSCPVLADGIRARRRHQCTLRSGFSAVIDSEALIAV